MDNNIIALTNSVEFCEFNCWKMFWRCYVLDSCAFPYFLHV